LSTAAKGLTQASEDAQIPERAEPRTGTIPGLTIHIRDVPGSKAREVVKIAVLPLVAASPEVTVELVIQAEGGLAGIPAETLNLVVLEGLRQLGLTNVELVIHDG
jgi:hypothetical protein